MNLTNGAKTLHTKVYTCGYATPVENKIDCFK